MVTVIWVPTSSGNGLLPTSTKPLPEPGLTNQWSLVVFTRQNAHSIFPWYEFDYFDTCNYWFKITATSPKANELNMLQFVPEDPIENKSTLIQVKAWHQLQHDRVDFGVKWHQFSMAAGLIRLHMPGVK